MICNFCRTGKLKGLIPINRGYWQQISKYKENQNFVIFVIIYVII